MKFGFWIEADIGDKHIADRGRFQEVFNYFNREHDGPLAIKAGAFSYGLCYFVCRCLHIQIYIIFSHGWKILWKGWTLL
jgi:hypothetical protein